ncbi:uncharacterized protein FIBRA_03972 [Fibroporia radiculosa]|uniref:Sensitive to high expression protein 9, mitochondrial n=1 Tax=Fibroporia radiculosa TaxID=599839 RepID=J4I9X1_9APHY|nr:uncharacterized protein FIBRA_03972 [Fibroporia radiculosa]CCM01901.1 predicted protein [Fibroporia radiculosa]
MFRTVFSKSYSSSRLSYSASQAVSLQSFVFYSGARRYASSEPHASSSSPLPGFQPDSAPRPESKQANKVDAISLENMKDRFREILEGTGTSLRQRIDIYTASLAVTFSQLGAEINKVTGYGEIEVLKRKVAEQEARIEAARQASREAKEAYDTAVRQRASSQREVNDLLQRKSSWSDEDVTRFTSLVRKDHLYEQKEARAKQSATQSEDAVEREFSELMRVILNRYHEEQAWSDKIRSASTYGSLAVMGANLAVFILAIVIVEPWKRRRLAQTFERKVEEMSANNSAVLESKTEELAKRLGDQDLVLSQLMETIHYSTHIPETDQSIISQSDSVEEFIPGSIEAGVHTTMNPAVANSPLAADIWQFDQVSTSHLRQPQPSLI